MMLEGGNIIINYLSVQVIFHFTTFLFRANQLNASTLEQVRLSPPG